MPTNTNTNTAADAPETAPAIVETTSTPEATTPPPAEVSPPAAKIAPTKDEVIGADEPVAEKKGIIDQIDDAKKDSKSMQDESAELAAENGIELKEDLTKGERLLAALGYISWLCILPLVIKPHSNYCQTHGRQGLIITLSYFFLGWMGIFSIWINVIITIVYIIFMIWGIIKSTQGLGKERLPGVGIAADKLDWTK